MIYHFLFHHQNDFQSGLLVPVWDFIGTKKYKYNTKSNDENGEKSISEKQKNMYMKFIEEQIRIKSEVERIITEKYNFIDKSELLNSRPLSIYFELSGNVKLTCSIGSEGDEIIEIELLPQVKFNKVL